MRRVLIVVAAGALALGACGGGDDDTADPTTTTERPGTTAEATTTTFEPAVAGILEPPAGVTQAQADGFARDMVFALQGAGWPDLPRGTSVSLLQDGLGLGSQMCALADSTGDEAAVGGAVAGLARQQQPAMSQALVDSGLPADQAERMSAGFVAGMTEASGAQLCPQWRAQFSAAAEQYA